MAKNNSIVKTFRLTNELNIYLEEEAKKSNRSVSSLSSDILSSYRDRYSKYDKVKPLAIPPDIFVKFIDPLDEEVT
jgi:hypothetical protein